MQHPTARLTFRIDFEGGDRLGPGKIALLEHIRAEGSISGAARAMDMSYRRAWLLVDSLNEMFAEPAVQTRIGRSEGGGAVLTPFGERLVAIYRAMERGVATAVRPAVRELERARPQRPQRPQGPQRPPRPKGSGRARAA